MVPIQGCNFGSALHPIAANKIPSRRKLGTPLSETPPKEQGIVAIGICACFDGLLNWQVLWKGIFTVRTSKRETSRGESSGISGESSDSNNDEEVHERLIWAGAIVSPDGTSL